MVMPKCIIFVYAFVFIIYIAHAQNQTDFISIDCGFSDSYTDKTSGIHYVSDSNYTASGENFDVSAEFKVEGIERQFWSVRSFPDGKRNCYTLKPLRGNDTRYLVRARFFYGNYDNKSVVPSFSLYIGVDLWDAVLLGNDTITDKEIVHLPSSDSIDVCLVNIGLGVPFISVLELRPLPNETYFSQAGTGLQLYERFDFGSNASQFMRYKDDIYDRLWLPVPTTKLLKTSPEDEISIKKNLYGVPSRVISTAFMPNMTTGLIAATWSGLNVGSKYFFYFHFAELANLTENQSREFNIFFNGELWFGPHSPKYLRESTIFSLSGIPTIEDKIVMLLNKTENSTLPPLLNALEIYELKNLPQIYTDQSDVEAILKIKSVYEVNRNSWQGDPCAPKDYIWDGLNCSYNGNLTHRITSLDLSSSGLKGEITPYIAGLTMLESLDLSNNSLSGPVQAFLADLESLRVLNLKGNNLEGPVPQALLDRIKTGLSLSVDDNLMGNMTSTSQNNRTSSSSGFPSAQNNFAVPIVVSFWGFLIFSVL